MTVCEPERTLRYQIQYMLVYVEWVFNTKPGGTAGVILLSLQILIVGDEGIFLWENRNCCNYSGTE